MNNKFSSQITGCRKTSLAKWTTNAIFRFNPSTLFKKPGTSSFMNRAINTATTQHSWIGSIHDCINLSKCDITFY